MNGTLRFIDYHVVKYTASGEFVGVVSGLGANRGTWDSSHTKETARRHARKLRKKNDGFNYQVEQVS